MHSAGTVARCRERCSHDGDAEMTRLALLRKGLVTVWAVGLAGVVAILLSGNSAVGLLGVLGIEKSMNLRLLCVWAVLAVCTLVSLWLLKDGAEQ